MRGPVLVALAATLLLRAATARACPAIPGPVEVSQPGGSPFSIEVFGDERLHFVRETATGYTIIQAEDGSWWYADLDAAGRLVATTYRVGSVDPARTALRPGLVPRARELNVTTPSKDPRRASTGKSAAFPLPPTATVLALMCQFPGTSGVNTNGYWEGLLFGPSTSVAAYYDEVSYGQFAISGVAEDWRTLPRALSSYDADPNLWTHFIADAVAAFDASIDFSVYDRDGDGMVDHLILICAGDDPSDGSGTGLWPRMSWSLDPVETQDGVSIGNFVLVDDYTFEADHRACLGTVCHEFGHNLAWPLGFADLYDPDAGSMASADDNDYPVRHWCLMGDGNWSGPTPSTRGSVPAHPSAFDRMQAGWITPVTLTLGGTYSLSPVEGATGTRLYKVPVAAKPQEFFLLEFRKSSEPCTFDKYSAWCTYAGDYPPLDSGLLVTQVDSTMWAKAYQNAPNGGTPSYEHYAVHVVDSGFQGYTGATCPDTVVTHSETRTSAAFSSEDGATAMTSPLGDRFDGTKSGVSLSGIGASAGPTMVFTLSRTSSPVSSRLLLYDDSVPAGTFTSVPGQLRGVRFAAPGAGTTYGIDRAYVCVANAGLPASFKLRVMNEDGTADLVPAVAVTVTPDQACPMWREVDLTGYTALRNLPTGSGFMIAMEYTAADLPYLWFDPFTGAGHSYEKSPGGAWSLSQSGGPIDYLIRADVSASGLVPVLLTSFHARVVEGGVRLDWTAGDPIEPVGFRVYRSAAGSDDWAPLNETLVTAPRGQYSYTDVAIIAGNSYRYRLGEVERDGTETPMGLVEIEIPSLLAPRIVRLRALPNPTRSTAEVRVTASWSGWMRIEIYNATGRRVRLLADGPTAGGEHAFNWDGLDDLGKPVGSGVYFVRARLGGQGESEKLTILRW